MEYSNTGNYVSAFRTQQETQQQKQTAFGIQQHNQTAFGTQQVTTQQQNQVITTQPTAITNQAGEPNFISVLVTRRHFEPYDTICPHCNQQIKTEISHSIGYVVWLCCFIILISGGVGFCCIPFFCDSCKDVTHTCPSCRRTVAVYKRDMHTKGISHLRILQTDDYGNSGSPGQGFGMTSQQQFGMGAQPPIAQHPGLNVTQPSIVQQPGLKAQYPGEPYFGTYILSLDHFKPYDTTCPHCNQQVRTRTSYKIGKAAWCMCIILFVSVAIPFCCIPLFCKSMKDTIHTCPSCSREIRRYYRYDTWQKRPGI